MQVMKFGGTSVGSAERMRGVVRLVSLALAENRVVVVASALAGVTNLLVDARAEAPPHAVRGISFLDDLALLNITGPGMPGVPGVAARVFGALAARDISVVLISQASSECAISLCVRERPLVVQGYGAGPEVTAAGVLADILKIATRGTL
jgi:aspartokinase